ncbi:61 endoglucanase [Coprinopsis sp. MPI-PUGE-AT-0042]|nr:61 endoglucanase [Coprinopsis sp. MPI-PUGE-AT-0042]
MHLSLWSLALATALAALGVRGHGWVQEVTLGGTKYTGYLPYVDPYVSPAPQRIVRKVPWNGPVQNLTLFDIQCNGYTAGGVSPAPAPLVGLIASGSNITFHWTSWPDNHKGPVITYMARVPDDQDVTKWTPGGDEKVWFKVHEIGKNKEGKWASEGLGMGADGLVSVRVPKGLRKGVYIIRHEIMALHFAFAYPGIQIYPSCVQVEVTGDGDAFPTEFVSFPGAYTPTTPGIVYDLYSDTAEYPIPGPKVWTGGD